MKLELELTWQKKLDSTFSSIFRVNGCKFSLGNRALILISMVESEMAHDFWINAGKGIINNEEATSGREN